MAKTVTKAERSGSRRGLKVRLAPRLQETLELLLEGLDKREIAQRMNLSGHTVHGYIRELYRIYDVPTRARLMALWVRHD